MGGGSALSSGQPVCFPIASPFVSVFVVALGLSCWLLARRVYSDISCVCWGLLWLLSFMICVVCFPKWEEAGSELPGVSSDWAEEPNPLFTRFYRLAHCNGKRDEGKEFESVCGVLWKKR